MQMGKTNRKLSVLAIVASLALAMGLVPLPAFADDSFTITSVFLDGTKMDELDYDDEVSVSKFKIVNYVSSSEVTDVKMSATLGTEPSGLINVTEPFYAGLDPSWKEVEVTLPALTHKVKDEDILNGGFTLECTATGKRGGVEITASESRTFKTVDPHPSLAVSVETTSAPASNEGYAISEAVNYKVTVSNNGNLTITGITVVDTLTGGSWEIESLEPKKSQEFTTSHTVTESDFQADAIANAATATGASQDPEHKNVSATSDAKVVPLKKYRITATAAPEMGGTVSGAGTFTYGNEVAVTATPKEGYVFDCWTEGGARVDGAGAEYTFPATADRALVANFRQVSIDNIADQTYTGSAIEPKGLHVELLGVDGIPSNVALIENKDYTLSYENNVNAGEGTVIVTFINKFTGTATKAFNIKQASLEGATVEVADQVYDGTALEPVPTVTWNEKQVIKDDYTVTYADNVRAGTATVTVTGKRNFTESSKARGTFKIAKRPITITADSAERTYDGTALTADSFTSEGLAEGDKVASAKVEGSQTNVGSSANVVSGAKIVNTAGEDVTDCYDITYKPGTLTVKARPTPAYEPVKGDGSTWTNGSADALTFTFKRTTDDEATFGHFTGVKVDGKAVPEKDASGKANWTAKAGSVVLSLQPSFLETLSDGAHTVAASFDDGDDVTATFKIASKAAPADNKAASSSSAKTGDTLPLMAVMVALVLSAAALVMSRRKLVAAHPAKRGKHAR